MPEAPPSTVKEYALFLRALSLPVMDADDTMVTLYDLRKKNRNQMRKSAAIAAITIMMPIVAVSMPLSPASLSEEKYRLRTSGLWRLSKATSDVLYAEEDVLHSLTCIRRPHTL